MSISLAVSTVTVTKVTILTTSCLTSVWILTSVWKADLIATRALILKEGNTTFIVCVSVLQYKGSAPCKKCAFIRSWLIEGNG